MNKDKVYQLARDSWLLDKHDCSDDWFVRADADLAEVEAFAALIEAAVREECAALCDAIASAAECNEMVCDEDKIEFYSSRHLAADDCADLIREWGQNV